jgi:PAS domain S-box-containing protein
VDDFLKKPFGMEEFMHIVEKNITNYRLEHEREQYIETINAFNDELLEKSERISAILYSLAEGVFTVNEKMEITHFNRSAEMLVGIPGEKALGRKCSEIMPNALCQQGCPVKLAMKRHEPVLGVETEVLINNEKAIPVMVSASVLKDSAGNIIGGVEVFRDISESKRMMKALEQSKEEIRQWNLQLEQRVQKRTRDLQEANQKIQEAQAQMLQAAKMAAVGQLGAGVAHELNNPLGGILGYAQLILQKVQNNQSDATVALDCKKYAEHIEVESLRCKAIIENLLLFSKKPLFTLPEPIDIGQVIHDAVLLIQYQFDATNVGVTLNLKKAFLWSAVM